MQYARALIKKFFLRVKRLELLHSKEHQILSLAWLPISAYSRS